MASINLKTKTIIDYKTNQTVDIKVIYDGELADELPNILAVDIVDDIINVVQQGNLFAVIKNTIVIQLQVDINGHLILFLTSEEENHYAKDVIQGHLTYEKQ